MFVIKATNNVEDFNHSTHLLGATTLRSSSKSNQHDLKTKTEYYPNNRHVIIMMECHDSDH